MASGKKKYAFCAQCDEPYEVKTKHLLNFIKKTGKKGLCTDCRRWHYSKEDMQKLGFLK